MPQYNVKYKCGHEKVTEVNGTPDAIQKRLNWFSTISCPDCYNRYMIQNGRARKVSYREYKDMNPKPKSLFGTYDPIEKTIYIVN